MPTAWRKPCEAQAQSIDRLTLVLTVHIFRSSATLHPGSCPNSSALDADLPVALVSFSTAYYAGPFVPLKMFLSLFSLQRSR